MATFSTVDALTDLVTAIPAWTARLDDLNSQISQRQIELARLTEEERPPTRSSIRNKGSTESLRPQDGAGYNADDTHDTGGGITISPLPIQEEAAILPPPVDPPPESQAENDTANPRPAPGALTRQTSRPVPPTQPYVKPTVLRKRKTESLASGGSQAPKYRTRSMIIVYYDSAVQTAFEEVVRFISGSRNTMRKGKMVLKMMEMRKAADLENDEDEDDDFMDGDKLMAKLGGNYMKSRNLLTGQQAAKERGGQPAADPTPPGPQLETRHDGVTGRPVTSAVDALQVDLDSTSQPNNNDEDEAKQLRTSKLQYLSTRQMGPPRATPGKGDSMGASLNIGMLRGYRRAGAANCAPRDVFDELDKGLEWCQSQCEHAAHQFLRVGECEGEIGNIKRKFGEVVERASREVEKLRLEEAGERAEEGGREKVGTLPLELLGRGRVLSSVQMRKGASPKEKRKEGNKDKNEVAVSTKHADSPVIMEVDEDEGIDDMDLPSMLVYKRTREL